MNAMAIPELIGRATGVEVAALAVVCTVGNGEEAAVSAILSPGISPSPSFRDAIERETEYSKALLDFDEPVPPTRGIWGGVVDLESLADLIGVDRVICMITQSGTGQINVTSAYDGLEVTLLEAAKLQLDRFVEVLDGSGQGRPRVYH